MVRSMFSGVAGMKAHQTKLDVIGNNISNVNTYGFKSSRATFRDVYYQSMRGAASGTGSSGGLNPSQVGYGATIGSVDVLQTQSIMSSTGNPLDVAITGEGFLQVQDSDGSIYYTKAGMLNIDSYGNLVDLNGNFVLGVAGSPVGKSAGSERIQFNVPSIEPSISKVSNAINSINYTVSTSKETQSGNISLNINSSSQLPLGQKVTATVTSNGVVVNLNAKEYFGSLEELNREINAAIKTANGGKDHPAGNFTITMDDDSKFKLDPKGLTGAQIAGRNFGIEAGKMPLPSELQQLFAIESVGNKFTGGDTANPKAAYTIKCTTQPVPGIGETLAPGATAVEGVYEISAAFGGKVYKATLTSGQMKAAGSIVMKNQTTGADSTDCFTLQFPGETAMVNSLANKTDGKLTVPYTFPASWNATEDAVASKQSADLGLSSQPFKLSGGTEGGPQTVKDLSGISIGADGVILASYGGSADPLEIGRIDLATFDNPAGLAQSGNTYFTQTANSGKSSLAKPGEKGTGALAGSSLEMSNVDLSQEFADMITTQRGFQANSRLITVSDTLLEELINLKR